MARAITSPELAKLRSDGQQSELYLAVLKPATVFAARLNGTLTTTDSVVELPYDTVTAGAYESILPGQTVYIGSSAGAYDKGMVRVRSAAGSATLPIGETSDVDFSDNDYITVVNEFGIWPKHIYRAGDTWNMDYDIAYFDQHANPDPCPVCGPAAAVIWLPTGGTVTHSPTAASAWVSGGSITGYAWTATGGTIAAGGTTTTPTIRYTSAGTYRVDCTVTASNGKTATGRRWVFVYNAANMPVSQFSLKSCSGDIDSGGWSFTIDAYAEAGLSDIRDRAMVVLFAKDFTGSTLESLGPVSGYENVIAVGWVDGESIEYGSEYGTVTFSVQGPAFWMKNIYGFPVGLQDTTSAPTNWLQMQSLTVDKGLWHFLHWRSTVDTILDVILTGDTRMTRATEAAAGSLWNQLTAISQPILGLPLCDRYGRLFVELETNLTPVASRSSIPTVIALTSADWSEKINIERRVRPQIGMLEASGVSWDGTSALPFFARSGGRVMRLFGGIETRDRLLLSDQADCNAQAGLLSAQANNKYPNVDIALCQNNRFIDIAPRQYLTQSIAAGDTPRGITWTNQKLIARRVEFAFENGMISTLLECEAETTPELATTYIPPAVTYPDISTPDLPNFPDYPPGNVNFPSVVPVDNLQNCGGDVNPPQNGPYSVVPVSSFSSGQSVFIFYPCVVRSSTMGYKTQLHLHTAYALTASGVAAYAIDAGKNRLFAASSIANDDVGDLYTTIEFSPGSPTSVSGFEVVIPAGNLIYTPGSTITSGSVAGNNETGVTLSGLTVGNWYALEASGGPVTFTGGGWSYQFAARHGGGYVTMEGDYYTYAAGFYPRAPFGPLGFASWVVEGINGGHCNRVFFKATQATVDYRYSDDPGGFGDNAGSLGYALRNATVGISLREAYLLNVCSV